MVALPFCHIEKTTKKTVSKAYPKELVTIGDHIRKRRLDLKLTQKEVAAALGVDECTVWNWERNRTCPLTKHLPAIIGFLGYAPFENTGKSLGERLLLCRMRTGLTQKELAKAIGIDSGTLSRMEKGSSSCFKRVLKVVTDFLSSADPKEDR